MNEIVKEETKDLDIHNLTKDDLLEIVHEIFRFYSEFEFLPLYRGSGSHVRMYPSIGKERIYISELPRIVEEKFFKDLKKMSSQEKINLHNIYKDEKCVARNLDMKAYLFDTFQSGDYYYLNDILFLKLFKHGLIDIKLYEFKHNRETESGKKFYAFMDKYNITSKNFHSSKSGKSEYDIKDIIENDYKTFINHFLNNIVIEGDERDEYFFTNRLDFVATIPSIKTFFIKINSFLSKYYEDSDLLRNEFINILKHSDSIIKIPYNEYFNEKILYFEYLKYLEGKNKLKIKKVYEEKIVGKPNCIVFEIEKCIYEFNELDLINFENVIKEEGSKQIIYKYEFKNEKLYINGKEFKVEKSEKTEYFIKLINIYLSTSNSKTIPISKLIDIYEKDTKDLKYLTLTSNNIKTSYISTIHKQIGECFSNNEILKIKGNDIILM